MLDGGLCAISMVLRLQQRSFGSPWAIFEYEPRNFLARPAGSLISIKWYRLLTGLAQTPLVTGRNYQPQIWERLPWQDLHSAHI
jgi:hypothetical protein